MEPKDTTLARISGDESQFLHDLSTPLTVTLGTLEALGVSVTKLGDTKSNERVKRALDSVHQVINMVNERKQLVRKQKSGK